MEETVICKLCFEPIFNLLCINCMSKSISSWLSSLNPKLSKEYKKFHKKILKKFSSEENVEKCIKCRENIDTALCPYCYANEVFWWLFYRDIKVAQRFVKLFNFDFFGAGYLPDDYKKRELKEVIITDKEEIAQEGICENCGEYSEDLKEKNGLWLCEVCRDD